MAVRSVPPPDARVRHTDFVRAAARAALGGDEWVDDVVQETWLVALRGGARRARVLRAGLGGVAWRQAKAVLRQRTAERRRDRRAARAAHAESTSDAVVRAETGRRLVAAVLALEEPYRTAVLLRYQDDLPPREIAHPRGSPSRPSSSTREAWSRSRDRSRSSCTPPGDGAGPSWCPSRERRAFAVPSSRSPRASTWSGLRGRAGDRSTPTSPGRGVQESPAHACRWSARSRRTRRAGAPGEDRALRKDEDGGDAPGRIVRCAPCSPGRGARRWTPARRAGRSPRA